MSRCKAVPIALRSIERRVLTARARRARGERRVVGRARIVLAAADGHTCAAIARRLGVTEDTVRRWRGRFAAERLPGLDDRPRTGRPRIYSDVAAAEVKAMACALPAETGVALARWSSTELAAEAITRGVLATVSASTVRRWLNADAIKPWQCRSWIFPRDPDFAAKAARVLDLYDRLWAGRRLADDEYVISADEKSQLQALRRRHPDLPPSPGPAAGTWPGATTGVRVSPRRPLGLPGRLRRPPRPGDRSLRPNHRDRTVRPAGRAGHDQRALRKRQTGVLGRGSGSP